MTDAPREASAEIRRWRMIAAKAWLEGCMFGEAHPHGVSGGRMAMAKQWAAEEFPYPTETVPA